MSPCGSSAIRTIRKLCRPRPRLAAPM
jgi:hypothetical protein